jgi:predicted transcriptional regulator
MKQILGNLEQKIINVLWDSCESLKPKEVNEKLEGKYAYTTIMTVLTRMEEKGILTRNKKGNAFYYKPVNCRDDFAKQNLGCVFKNILDNYKKAAIDKFIDSVKNDDDLYSYLKSKI